MHYDSWRIVWSLLYRLPDIKGEVCVQANNAYIFPAIGLAAVLTGASHISDDAFLTAANHLSEMTQIPVSRICLSVQSFGGAYLQTQAILFPEPPADCPLVPFAGGSQRAIVSKIFLNSASVCQADSKGCSVYGRGRWRGYGPK